MDSQDRKDDVVNTFHWSSPDNLTGAELTALGAALTSFYTAITSLLSPTVATAANAHTHKLYTVDVGLPGAEDDDLVGPVAQIPFTLGAGGASPIPSEVAICLSLAAVNIALVDEEGPGTRPKSRYRGRVFLGPLATSTMNTEATSNICRVDSGARTQIVNAAEAMMDAALANAGVTLSVYSRADNLFRPVEQFKVDNAFDTVRSRGQRANAATVLTHS